MHPASPPTGALQINLPKPLSLTEFFEALSELSTEEAASCLGVLGVLIFGFVLSKAVDERKVYQQFDHEWQRNLGQQHSQFAFLRLIGGHLMLFLTEHHVPSLVQPESRCDP